MIHSDEKGYLVRHYEPDSLTAGLAIDSVVSICNNSSEPRESSNYQLIRHVPLFGKY